MKILTNIRNIDSYKINLKVEDAINKFFRNYKYLKIDLPVLSPALIPESYLEVFETEFKYLEKKEKLYLTPSPEIFLKRLLAYGINNCYYLGKAFRNSDKASNLHNPEFTILEFYKTKADYMNIADVLLELLCFIAVEIKQDRKIFYSKKKISFEKWEKITVTEAFEKYAQISKEELFNHKRFLKKAKYKGYNIKGFSYEELFSQIYVQEIEPRLGKNNLPTLIYDYPLEFAALAKPNKDGITSQRFEFYIEGIELGDCYTELTDWKEQMKRFINEQKNRKTFKKIQHPVDKGFIKALKYGLIDCAGIAIGFDRLAMIFADATSINKLKLINIF